MRIEEELLKSDEIYEVYKNLINDERNKKIFEYKIKKELFFNYLELLEAKYGNGYLFYSWKFSDFKNKRIGLYITENERLHDTEFINRLKRLQELKVELNNSRIGLENVVNKDEVKLTKTQLMFLIKRIFHYALEEIIETGKSFSIPKIGLFRIMGKVNKPGKPTMSMYKTLQQRKEAIKNGATEEEASKIKVYFTDPIFYRVKFVLFNKYYDRLKGYKYNNAQSKYSPVKKIQEYIKLNPHAVANYKTRLK